MLCEGILGHAFRTLHQCLDAVDMFTELIHAGTEHGTLDLYHVGVAGQDGIDADRVVVCHAERGHVELVDIIDGILCPRLADDTHRLTVGIAGKAAGIVDQRADALVFLHLVVHGALDLTRHVDQTVVRAYDDDVVVAQAYIAAELAVEDVVIDIDRGDQLVVAINLDVTQRTDLAGTSCHVEGVED